MVTKIGCIKVGTIMQFTTAIPSLLFIFQLLWDEYVTLGQVSKRRYQVELFLEFLIPIEIYA